MYDVIRSTLMKEVMSIRVEEKLKTELDSAGINRADVARTAYEDALLDAAVGVCAITGDTCYFDSFATVGTATQIGETLDIPSDVEEVDITDPKFIEVTKTITQDGDKEGLEAHYLNQLGPATYRAEVEYLASVGTNTDHLDGWARYRLENPIENEDDFRLATLIEFVYENSDIDHHSGFITLDNIWDEHSEGVQNTVIGRANSNPNTPLAAALEELGVTIEPHPDIDDIRSDEQESSEAE